MKEQQEEMPTEEGVLSKAVLQECFDDMDEKQQNQLLVVAHKAKAEPLNMLAAMIVQGQQQGGYASIPKFFMVQ